MNIPEPQRSPIKPSGLIRLTLTAQEGFLIAIMLEAAMEQFANAPIEERNDPDLIQANDIWTRVRKLLPVAVNNTP